ncbi:MAG: GNAT family N-acetyltransferase [Deltaproteobacteria bacterium]|nr:GNAT family N-acetyltransferase [Deltaproteobacteria bacterium]
MRDAWNRLHAKSGAQAVFLTCDWLYAWSEIYATGGERRPHVLTVWNDKDLLAIAPLIIRKERVGPFRIRTLAFLGTPEASSDYLDVIVRSGKEKDAAVALFGHLFGIGRSLWDRLQFVDVPCDSPFFLWFLKLMEAEGKHFDAVIGSFCPIASLPGTREAFFRDLTVSGRQTFNRESKLLAGRGRVDLERVTGDAVVEALGSFVDLYERRWASRDERFALFLKTYVGSTSGEETVRIDFLKVDGRLVAGLFHLRHEETESMYLMAVDREFEPRISIGNIIVGMCIGLAIEQGVRTYDFLKGDEPYKFRWARGGKRLMDIRVHNPTPGAFLLLAWRTVKSLGKVLLR